MAEGEISGQIFCSLPNALILENIEGGSWTALNALVEPIEITDGHFTPPARPGHGIEFDRDYLEAYAV